MNSSELDFIGQVTQISLNVTNLSCNNGSADTIHSNNSDFGVTTAKLKPDLDLTIEDEIIKWISVVILVGIIVFNSLVIFLLCLYKRNSRMAFFVKNLALADLCVGLIFLLPEVISARFGVGWEKQICYILYGLKMFPIYVSTFAIVILAIDRVYVIIRPLASIPKRVAYRYGLVILTWVLAILTSIPYITHVRYRNDIYNGYCYINFKMETISKMMLIFDISLNLVIPVIIIASCYTCIVITICRREKDGFLRKNAVRYTHKTQNVNFLSKSHNQPCLIKRAKIRTIKLLLVVVLAYVVCWTPVCVGMSLLMWKIIRFGTAYKFLYVLAPLNSFVNPLVFLLFNRKMFQKKTIKVNKQQNTMTLSLSFRSLFSQRLSSLKYRVMPSRDS